MSGQIEDDPLLPAYVEAADQVKDPDQLGIWYPWPTPLLFHGFVTIFGIIPFLLIPVSSCMSTFGLELQDRQRRLLLATYPIFIVMAVNPIISLLVTRWPAKFDNLAWRFFFSGQLISDAMPYHATGLALILLTATLLGHRNVVRAVAIAAVVSALLIGIAAASFGLDALQMRRTVPQGGKPQFDAAGLKTLVFSVTLAPALLWMAIRALGATHGTVPRTVKSDAGLVVGR